MVHMLSGPSEVFRSRRLTTDEKLAWGKEHVNWASTQWARVLLRNETRFSLRYLKYTRTGDSYNQENVIEHYYHDVCVQ